MNIAHALLVALFAAVLGAVLALPCPERVEPETVAVQAPAVLLEAYGGHDEAVRL